ncbi:MAG: hypothetical protein H6718_18520 [Polyangiaceae bacterium]|nr:hypothetical protein [Myxococcales bacterium]MCB9587402.1 hypothetical protein [Polyangiaceae bacterium]MCB9605801.1 hypothetical protein [Polyangiaceae bacterium]
MQRLTATTTRLLLTSVLVLAPGASSAMAAGTSAPPPQTPRTLAKASGQGCVEYTTQVSYRNYGYDHWVKLQSACEKPVKCHAASNSNPTGVDQSLAPGEAQTVLLFRGSPASEFTATVSCSLD